MNTRSAFYTKRCCGRGRPRSRLACFPFHPEHRTFANPGHQPITLSADGAVRGGQPRARQTRAQHFLTDGRRIRQTAFPRNRWVAGGCAFSACFARSAVGSAGVPARTEKGRARFRCAVWRPMNTRPAFFTKRCCGRGRPRSRLACFPFHPEHRTFANPGRQPIILSADGAVRAPSPAHLFHQKRIPFVPRSPPFTFTFPFTYTTPPFSRVRERVPLRCERVRLSRTCRDRRPATPNS